MLKERIAIVTGANNGLGFQTVIWLVKNDIKVIMACRNEKRGIDAKNRIFKDYPKAKIDLMIIDLSDNTSVRNFVSDFSSKYDHLDILINNAGILLKEAKIASNGNELMFQTNYLGHFLLTNLLLKMMPNSSESRIISYASLAHLSAKIHFDNLHCETPMMSYGQSKLACLMFSQQLAKNLKEKDSKIKAIAVHPGGTRSSLFNNYNVFFRTIFYIIGLVFMMSTKNGARFAKKAAIDSNVQSGDYLGPIGFFEIKGFVGRAHKSKYSKNAETQKMLWNMSNEMVEEDF